jgi:hypothetical protein
VLFAMNRVVLETNACLSCIIGETALWFSVGAIVAERFPHADGRVCHPSLQRKDPLWRPYC